MTDVFLAVGHGIMPSGAYDPGAVGSDGRQEHREAFEVCTAATAGMRRSGLNVVSEVDLGVSKDPDYIGSVNRANRLNPKVAIEVHFDWSGGIDGYSGLYCADDGKRLAADIGDAFTKHGLARKSDANRPDLYFLNGTSMCAVIVETRRVHDYPAVLNRAQGEAIAEGTCHYLGHAYKAPTPTVSHEYRADGKLSLNGIAEHVNVRVGTLIRRTALHYGAFDTGLFDYLNALAAGASHDAPVRAGTRFWTA